MTDRATVTVHTRVSAQSVTYNGPTAWHRADWRCRVSTAVYRVAWAISNVADRIDDPRRHL